MDKSAAAVAVFNKQAGVYQDKFMNVDLYSDTLDLFCNSISKPGAAILDIACGPGNITKYLLQKRPAYKILGIDLAPNMIALAAANNHAARFQVMDCRDISIPDKQYDAIMCGFALPYLSKEEAVKLVSDAAKLLVAGGILYLSTMEEDDNNRSGLRTSGSGDELYVYYHRAAHLVQALSDNGFTIIDERRLRYTAADGAETTDLIIIAEKQNPQTLS